MKWYHYIITLIIAIAGYSAVFPLSIEKNIGAEIKKEKTVQELKKEKFDNVLATSKIDTENKKKKLSKTELVELKSYAIKQKTKLGKFSNKDEEKLGAIDTEPFYEVEIVEINEIDGGIEVFARAWKDGKQLGFGSDGSVDIERFRIFNPPVLVDDPNGDIVRTWTQSSNGKLQTRTLREDEEEALRQSLIHIVGITGDEDTKIEIGKRGNTTSTFYPDADPETNTVDGRMYEDRYNNWATTRNSTACRITGPSDSGDAIDASIGNGNGASYYSINRMGMGFYTAPIPDSDPINSATVSLYGAGSKQIAGSEERVFLVSFSPSSNTNLVTTDFDNRGSVAYGTSSASWTIGGYNDIPLNTTGIAAISKTAATMMAGIAYYDYANVAPTTLAEMTNGVYYADQTGTANDPKLVVEHGSAAVTPVQMDDIIYY